MRVSPFRDLGKQPGSNLLKASPPNWNKLIYPSAALPRRAHPHPGCGGGWGSPCPPARGCGDTHGRSVRVGPTLPRRAGREGAVPRPLAGSGSRRAAPPQELLFGLFSALCTPAAAASPLRPGPRLPPYSSSSSGQAAPQRNAPAKPTGDPGALRTRSPWERSPHGRAGGQHPPVGLGFFWGGGGNWSIPHPAGHPRDCLPPAARGTETRRAAPRRACPRCRPTAAASGGLPGPRGRRLARGFGWLLGFFSSPGGLGGDSHRRPRTLPPANKQGRRV